MAEQLANVEGGIFEQLSSEDAHKAPKDLFFHSDRIESADWVAGEQMRKNAYAYWKYTTRVTACKKNVVFLEDGVTEHPIHYIEDTIADVHQKFLKSGFTVDPEDKDAPPTFAPEGHFYPAQILVRNAEDGTTNWSVRSAFAQWAPTSVSSRARDTYFYVTFGSAHNCETALLAASSESFSLKATISRRPRMGYTAFSNERPVFVKDATEASCVCHRCQGFVYLLEAALRFKHWHECCPQLRELLEDVRNNAKPFSPSVVSLLDVILCPRDPITDLHRKTCSYGKCNDCGWAARMADLHVKDEVDIKDESEGGRERKEAKTKEVLVHFKAYENVETDSKLNNDGEAKQKNSSRPTLLKQSVAPSLFVPLFRDAVRAFQQHRSDTFLGGKDMYACYLCLHWWCVVRCEMCFVKGLAA